VREKHQFDICSLKNSLNIPLEVLEENIENIDSEKDIFVMCRRGNRSQKAVDILKKHGITSKDIIGGLSYWSNYVDKKLPKY
jgi:adenylyltransferase/sulfurtransferase